MTATTTMILVMLLFTGSLVSAGGCTKGSCFGRKKKSKVIIAGDADGPKRKDAGEEPKKQSMFARLKNLFKRNNKNTDQQNNVTEQVREQIFERLDEPEPVELKKSRKSKRNHFLEKQKKKDKAKKVFNALENLKPNSKRSSSTEARKQVKSFEEVQNVEHVAAKTYRYLEDDMIYEDVRPTESSVLVNENFGENASSQGVVLPEIDQSTNQLLRNSTENLPEIKKTYGEANDMNVEVTYQLDQLTDVKSLEEDSLEKNVEQDKLPMEFKMENVKHEKEKKSVYKSTNKAEKEQKKQVATKKYRYLEDEMIYEDVRPTESSVLVNENFGQNASPQGALLPENLPNEMMSLSKITTDFKENYLIPMQNYKEQGHLDNFENVTEQSAYQEVQKYPAAYEKYQELYLDAVEKLSENSEVYVHAINEGNLDLNLWKTIYHEIEKTYHEANDMNVEVTYQLDQLTDVKSFEEDSLQNNVEQNIDHSLEKEPVDDLLNSNNAAVDNSQQEDQHHDTLDK